MAHAPGSGESCPLSLSHHIHNIAALVHTCNNHAFRPHGLDFPGQLPQLFPAPSILSVGPSCQDTRLCQIRSHNITHGYQLLHAAAHGRRIGGVGLPVVSHNRVYDYLCILLPELPYNIHHNLNLRLGTQKTADNTVKGQLQLLPLVNKLPHLLRVVVKEVDRESCVVGQNGGGDGTALDLHRR